MNSPPRFPITKSLTPSDATVLAEAVCNACGQRTPIYPFGGRTQMHYGMPPTREGIGVSLEKMARLIDYPADDMTVTVEAGMTFAALAKILAKNRQRLPVDVPQPEKATLGGLTSVNFTGPRRFGHGTLRDYLLGFTAVDGQGAVFSGGGRVVKNAAGYNLSRLMAGSWGTLGILTQLTFMVRPIPESAAVLACDVPDLATGEKLLAELFHSPVRPVAIDMLLGPAQHRAPIVGPKAKATAACLYAGFEGSAAEVQWMLETLRAQWNAAGITAISSVADHSVARFWQWLTDFPAEVQIHVLPSKVVNLLDALQTKIPGCSLIVHAGHGEVRMALERPSSAPMVENGREKGEGGRKKENSESVEAASSRFADLLREQLRPLADSFGGTLTVLTCPPGVTLTRGDVWGPRGDAFAVMQALKDQFDPQNILNPGRFVFEDGNGMVPLSRVSSV